MSRIEGLEQGSQEWLDFKMDKLGGTAASIIMGVSPWCTPLQLYRRMTGLEEPQKVNDAMLLGSLLEPYIREEFCERHTESDWEPSVWQHSKYPWLMASLDGDNTPDAILEIKTANKADHKAVLNRLIPPKYYPQIQLQLFVTGAKKAYYFSYNEKAEQQYAEIVCENDTQYQEEMLKKLTIFWNCFVNLNPEPMRSTQA